VTPTALCGLWISAAGVFLCAVGRAGEMLSFLVCLCCGSLRRAWCFSKAAVPRWLRSAGSAGQPPKGCSSSSGYVAVQVHVQPEECDSLAAELLLSAQVMFLS
jgi:hypothetical protein